MIHGFCRLIFMISTVIYSIISSEWQTTCVWYAMSAMPMMWLSSAHTAQELIWHAGRWWNERKRKRNKSEYMDKWSATEAMHVIAYAKYVCFADHKFWSVSGWLVEFSVLMSWCVFDMWSRLSSVPIGKYPNTTINVRVCMYNTIN